jgi:DNA-binding transcriptional regulator YhcF (GntR family)
MYIVYIHYTMAAAPRVSIDLGSHTPAYRQIASDLRRHLVEERLKPGDLLPPIRQLALDLGVHFNTVAIAYRMLADEGWLELKRRRGAVVIARNAPQSMDRNRVDQLLQQLADIAAELRSAGMSARQISAALQRIAQGARP